VAASSYGLIGQSAAMRQTCQLISKVLHSPYTVLLRGETGTGKELVARAIHDCGPRRSRRSSCRTARPSRKTCWKASCSAIAKAPSPAPTATARAVRCRRRRHPVARRDRRHAAVLQAKLLRVLQEGEIRPLGSNDTHKIDVRIIAATHRDLAQLVADGLFREDLYYRLAQFPIELPPLRQRVGDVITLARHFCDKACAFCSSRWAGPRPPSITSATPSPATCASSRAWWSARCSCAKATR
jgi:sigma-54-dependent transcriptional regulator